MVDQYEPELGVIRQHQTRRSGDGTDPLRRSTIIGCFSWAPLAKVSNMGSVI